MKKTHLTSIKNSEDSGYSEAKVVPLTPEIAEYWHRNIQPHEVDVVAKSWNWPWFLYWTAGIERLQGRKTVGAAIVVKSQDDDTIPVALMILANNYPNVWDSAHGAHGGLTRGTWIWYAHKAPKAALTNLGVMNVKTLRNCIDTAVITSFNAGTGGRIMLNSSHKGGDNLRRMYAKVMGHDAMVKHSWRSVLRLKRRIGTLFAFNNYQATRFFDENRKIFP